MQLEDMGSYLSNQQLFLSGLERIAWLGPAVLSIMPLWFPVYELARDTVRVWSPEQGTT